MYYTCTDKNRVKHLVKYADLQFLQSLEEKNERLQEKIKTLDMEIIQMKEERVKVDQQHQAEIKVECIYSYRRDWKLVQMKKR